MRCLVTGAAGHLGAALVRHLTRHNQQVAAIVRPESDLRRLAGCRNRIGLVYADLTRLDPVAAQIRAFRPEVVFHLAWRGITRAEREDPAQIALNISAGQAIFDLVRDAGCRCWIGIGSQAEYGLTEQDREAVTEDRPAYPITNYGRAKLHLSRLTEQWCEAAGIRYVWLRLFAVYGPHDHEAHVIPYIIRSLLNRRAPSLTSGEQAWDYLYIDDAAAAIHAAALADTATGVFNLGSGDARTIRRIAESIRDAIDPNAALGFGEIAYPAGEPLYLCADTRRFQAATGWQPRVALVDGLNMTIDWYRAQYATGQEEP